MEKFKKKLAWKQSKVLIPLCTKLKTVCFNRTWKSFYCVYVIYVIVNLLAKYCNYYHFPIILFLNTSITPSYI